MKIISVRPTSTVDYRGHIASVVYFGGCNLRCPFCHNGDLVLPESVSKFLTISPEEALEQLASVSKLTAGVALSGGEPTLAGTDLIPFVKEIKKMNKLVKLDTNGLAPTILEALLTEHLIDYVALDAKTSLSRYSSELGGDESSEESFLATVDILHNHRPSVKVEARTTCVPSLVLPDDVNRLGEVLASRVDLWVLQQFRPRFSMTSACQKEKPYTAKEMRLLAEVAKEYVPCVELRGV